LEDYKLIWEKSKAMASSVYIDEEKAWERMHNKLYQKRQPDTVVRKSNFSFSRMAAVWIVVIAGAALITLYLLRNQTPETLVVKSEKAVRRDSLPDGSIVTLNKGSIISYPESFDGNTREVSLQGEGFFDIKPDKNKPFIIKTGDISITVVGTSFNVRNNQGNIEVIVETGIVEVSKKSHTIKLKPKEKVVVKKEDDLLQKEPVQDKLYNYYASKEFVCVNTPLWKLVQILNEAYDVHIVIARKEVGRLPLTTTFNNESLDQILTVISQTFNISVSRSGDTIILN
jgi:transmembrane sensor